MNIQPVKTAIVGCGAISDAYLNTMINRFKVLDVVGCCDRNPGKAQAAAQTTVLQSAPALTQPGQAAQPAAPAVIPATGLRPVTVPQPRIRTRSSR